MRDGHSYKHNKISIEMVSHKDQNPTAETIKIKTIEIKPKIHYRWRLDHSWRSAKTEEIGGEQHK
jgi:hypothetical protein